MTPREKWEAAWVRWALANKDETPHIRYQGGGGETISG